MSLLSVRSLATTSLSDEEYRTGVPETVATFKTDSQNPTGNVVSLSSSVEEKREGADGVKELAGMEDSGIKLLLCVQVT